MPAWRVISTKRATAPAAAGGADFRCWAEIGTQGRPSIPVKPTRSAKATLLLREKVERNRFIFAWMRGLLTTNPGAVS